VKDEGARMKDEQETLNAERKEKDESGAGY